MAVRRLHPDQPADFVFSPVNKAWADATIAKYPPGKQASAILPLLWRAQEQSGGWLPEPAIRAVCDLLGMAYIRGIEIATFYTMFQLSPVGSKAHIQVCGTTPCMLRGSNELVAVCRRRIAESQHTLSGDGSFSWEEVECIGNCANAPVVQVGKDTYEDLTPELLSAVIDGYLRDDPPKFGSQTGRTASCPEGGPTSLTDATLYDGSTIGAWRKRFEEVSSAPPAAPAVHPAALTAMANAGLVKELEARGTGKPLTAGELDKIKADMRRDGVESTEAKPALFSSPRDGKGDDLTIIVGVGDVLAKRLNDMGIWHFDQIASWTPENVGWFERELDGFKGRVVRDKWIEQSQKLATGWRPDKIGERPKG